MCTELSVVNVVMLNSGSGSGKQSLLALATYCAGMKLFKSLSPEAMAKQFKEDLKEPYKELGSGPRCFCSLMRMWSKRLSGVHQ